MKKPIINCHTHIFEGGHVPPYLGKTLLPWPLSAIRTSFVLNLLKKYLAYKNRKYKDPYREKEHEKIVRHIRYQRQWLLRALVGIVKFFIATYALYIVADWLQLIPPAIERTISWLVAHHLFYRLENLGLQIIWVLGTLLFIKGSRRFIWFLLVSSYRFLSRFQGQIIKDLIERYILLGRFTLYGGQSGVFSKLIGQYPDDSKFIVLPMDMAYMGAGELAADFTYKKQMETLADIKSKSTNKEAILPFVFVDPRRIRDEKDHFKYTVSNGTVNLDNCFIRDYIETKQFSGFKIYPALGYYPFDESLLPLWKYAADQQIPIMTHCIKGTIFYRGKKERAWEQHPVFKEYVNLKNKVLAPLLLPDQKQKDFSLNFTHPLNYLVLLKEELLRIYVSTASHEIQELFGYTNLNEPLKHNLDHLKICFAHFGGEDQWERYLEFDRYYYGTQLIQQPDHGIDFFLKDADNKDGNNTISWKKLEDCWKHVDWYSIISSLMLQHKNVYADISYILHNDSIFPLLKQTIDHPILGEKVLFGTDFYVVRNHKSEKDLMVSTMGNLCEAQFDKIARDNPINYLKRQ